jgi:hypothetical protein
MLPAERMTCATVGAANRENLLIYSSGRAMM